jgi:hypothetical protein
MSNTEQVYAVSIWSDLIKRKFDYVCTQCRSAEDVMAAYIRPPSLGGKCTLDNGVTLCVQCRSKGLIPHEKVRFNFSIPADLAARLETYCENSGRSGNDVVKQLVADFTYDTRSYLNGFHEDASKNDRRVSVPVLRMVYDTFVAKCAKLRKVPATVMKSLLYLYLPLEGASHESGRPEDREAAARLREQRHLV